MADLPVPGAPGQFSFVRKEDRETGDGGNMAGAFARIIAGAGLSPYSSKR